MNAYSLRKLYPGIRVALAATLLLPACSTKPTRDGQPPEPASKQTQSAQSTGEARSKRGNPPFYEVFGRRYTVMASSTGYQERGVASWYGKKFHGRQTSNGEVYNMYAMTGAHKTLPLPTTVRVTNLRNGKSVTVRLNDRGPFVKDRIIDLSYAAAKELDMIATGTTLVEVVAVPAAATTITAAAEVQTSPAQGDIRLLYLQVGAYGEEVNARAMQKRLQLSGVDNVQIHHDADTAPSLYRVRIGPISGVDEFDSLVERMRALNIHETHLVVESRRASAARLSDSTDHTPGG